MSAKRTHRGATEAHAVHVAALAAESDAVKLVKELEALRKQKEELFERFKESHDALRAANTERDMIVNRHREKLEMNERTSRVIDVQIRNVEELLVKIVRPRDELVNACADRALR